MRTKRRNALRNPGNTGEKYKKPGTASVNRWNKRDEIELDEEDAFHENRDKILLEGEMNDGSDDDLKDEVFALKNLHHDSDSGEDLHDVPDETDEAELESQTSATPKKSTKKATKKGAKASSGSSSDSEEQQESWGRSKSVWYSTNAAAIDSDSETDQKLEEAEVLKLQGQARAALEEDDFGVVEVPLSDLFMEDTPAVPAAISPSLQDPINLLQHLEKTDAVTLALAREWEDVVYDLAKSQTVIDLQTEANTSTPAHGMLQLYHQTLLTYATTLAFYLHLRSSPKYASNPNLLQAHPILSRLLTLKQAMASLERLDFGPGSDSDLENEEEEDLNMFGFWKDGLVPMNADETAELLREAQEMNAMPLAMPNGKEDTQKTNGSNALNGVLKEEKKKKKKKAEKEEGVPDFDLEEPEFVPSKKTKSARPKPSSDALDIFGEPTALSSLDSEDKAARKKSLKFHTSRIEQTSARREKARGGAIGGDDDIPYREREKEKELRLKKETERRRRLDGEDLEDGESFGENDTKKKAKKRPREDDEDEAMDIDGYYELIKRQKKEAKRQKQAKYDSDKAAEKAVLEGDEVVVDGQRGLTRAILKNKGLTPKRSKSVRNPRVKKRMKYDEAKKKVRSQKAVFKGGLAATGGRYEGEGSGISTKVVKSVKLG